jgi:hypothetical protein
MLKIAIDFWRSICTNGSPKGPHNAINQAMAMQLEEMNEGKPHP